MPPFFFFLNDCEGPLENYPSCVSSDGIMSTHFFSREKRLWTFLNSNFPFGLNFIRSGD